MGKIFAKFGIAGLALFVLLQILQSFHFNFTQIGESQSGFIAILVVSGVLIIALVAIVLHFISGGDESRRASEVVLLKYAKLTKGLDTPKQNVWAIEEIASSSIPQRQDFLRELQKAGNLSFIEQDAIAQLLNGSQRSGKGPGLYDILYNKEAQRWISLASSNGNPDMTGMAICGLKIWRYMNRKDHPQFAQVEQALARVLVSRQLDEKSFKLFNSLDIR